MVSGRVSRTRIACCRAAGVNRAKCSTSSRPMLLAVLSPRDSSMASTNSGEAWGVMTETILVTAPGSPGMQTHQLMGRLDPLGFGYLLIDHSPGKVHEQCVGLLGKFCASQYGSQTEDLALAMIHSDQSFLRSRHLPLRKTRWPDNREASHRQCLRGQHWRAAAGLLKMNEQCAEILIGNLSSREML